MKHVQLLQQHTFTESKIQSRHFTIFSYSSNMIKISGAYNQLTRILTWRGRRKTNETLPAETDGTADQPHDPQQPPKRKKSSLRRLTKIIHKRKTKDSVSKERLVTGVDHGNSEEKMPTADTQKVTVVAYQTNLQTTEDVDEGACAKSANDAAQFEQLNMGLAFASSQDDLDEDSLLNSSGNSFFLDVAFRQPLNASIEVLEEVHILLKDIAKVNRDSQERVSEKRLHWESTVKRGSYKDPMWELAKQEWAKLQLYHYEQEVKVAEALNNLKQLLAASDDEDDDDMYSQV